uniref:SH3 domain-containing YSC84-like protein 1 n=1 Tax=Lepisosteus oculatus TaxID=7918 RepID=W5NL02_LEPOC
NNPIPSNLKSEAKKAAKILREFTEISSRTGPDKLIPAHVIAKAQGLAIISVIKAGFMITARGGSGIVVARLPDGRWSAPSAIGIAGLGGGFEIGVEVSDLVIILNHRRAIEAFGKGGNLTLGGNCTVAVGPLGRNVEADVALRSTAAVYTYCKSRGLFAGISLEGSYLIERRETNRKFYAQDIRAFNILNGDVEPPPAASNLYEILEVYTEKYTTDWQRKNLRAASRKVNNPPERPLSRPQSQRSSVNQRPQGNTQLPTNDHSASKKGYKKESFAPVFVPAFYTQISSHSMKQLHVIKPSLGHSSRPLRSEAPHAIPSFAERHKGEGNPSSGRPSEGPLVVTAMHSFVGQQPGDLSFNVGDKITVITKSDSQYDWWEGQLRGEVGIFPANFVSYS